MEKSPSGHLGFYYPPTMRLEQLTGPPIAPGSLDCERSLKIPLLQGSLGFKEELKTLPEHVQSLDAVSRPGDRGGTGRPWWHYRPGRAQALKWTLGFSGVKPSLPDFASPHSCGLHPNP